MARYWSLFPGELMVVTATGLPLEPASTTVKTGGVSFTESSPKSTTVFPLSSLAALPTNAEYRSGNVAVFPYLGGLHRVKIQFQLLCSRVLPALVGGLTLPLSKSRISPLAQHSGVMLMVELVGWVWESEIASLPAELPVNSAEVRLDRDDLVKCRLDIKISPFGRTSRELVWVQSSASPAY